MARPACAKVRGHGTEEPPFWVSNERRIVYNTKVPRKCSRFFRGLASEGTSLSRYDENSQPIYCLIHRQRHDPATPRILSEQMRFRLSVNCKVGKLLGKGECRNTVHSIRGPDRANTQSEPGRSYCTSRTPQPETPPETHSTERLR